MGYWGTPTADMDFCEPNYAVTHFVAEFWNMLTSIPILLVGVSGVWLSKRQDLGPEQMAAYSTVGLIGLGSLIFHATLMRTGQVLDEVPMLWAALVLLYVMRHHVKDRVLRRSKGRRAAAGNSHVLLLGMGIYAAAATGAYFMLGFVYFVVAYALSILGLFLLAVHATMASEPPMGPQARRMVLSAGAVYGGGFALLWLPGEVLCHSVPLMQRLPMHALFHLTSAAGPHLGLTAFALARFDDEAETVARCSWPFAGLPAIDRSAALHKVV